MLFVHGVHFATCCFMTGGIWFVQVVHYPLFARVAPESFTTYHAAHVRRTSWVVVGPMLLELLSAFVVLSKAEEGTPQILSAIGLTLLMLIWGSTFLSQVPAHNQLARGYSSEIGRNLVKSNWTRTVLWSLRLPLVLWVTFQAFAGSSL